MFKPPSLSRADGLMLSEAVDIAVARMRLVEQVKKGTGAFCRLSADWRSSHHSYPPC
jgi:hypothetical protein